jgi:hypothetical protein
VIAVFELDELRALIDEVRGKAFLPERDGFL